MARRKKQDPIDAEIDRIFNTHCNGIQISVMDIPGVFAAGRAAHGRGEDIQAAVLAFVARVRQN